MKYITLLFMATMISCQPLHSNVEKTEINFSVDNIIDFVYDKNLDSYYIEYMDYDVFDLEHMNELSNNQFNGYITIKVDKDMFFTILEEVNTKPSREVSKKYKIIEYYDGKTFEYLLKKR
jgi:hypothetical protein